MKLIMTKGLPASGKSTWAKAMAVKSGGQTKRVNKDDLRAMLDGGKWSKNNEKNILKVRDLLVEHHLNNGSSVIVDDTNLHPKHAEVLKQIARKYEATFETKSFLDVSLKTCIERDLKRENSVGEKVIKGMFGQFLKEPPAVYDIPKNAPKAIVVDVDGTLAHMQGRSPYEWNRVHEDTLDEEVANIVRLEKQSGTQVIILTGRDGVCELATRDWLTDNNIGYDELYIRREGDERKDSIIKSELFETHIKNRFEVKYILDDRNQVVDMWRDKYGLKCLQVAEGDF